MLCTLEKKKKRTQLLDGHGMNKWGGDCSLERNGQG